MMTVLIFSAGILGILLLVLAVYYFLIPVRRPIPTHSDLSEGRGPWMIHYSHKYLHPIKLPPRDSTLDTYFRDLAFEFKPPPAAPVRTIRVAAVGDLMCRPDLTGSHPELWEHLAPQLFSADLSIGNLEFAVNPQWIIQKVIRYSVSPDHARPLLGHPDDGRFSCVSLGNNHLNDSLHNGIVSTRNFLASEKMPFVGANASPEDQDVFPVFDYDGVRVAVLSYTFSTNGIPLQSGKEYGVNLVRFNALDDNRFDPSLIHHHISLAKKQGASYIIACLHWGAEFEYYPQERIMRRGKALLDAGIDCIIGHHPHILQPVDHYRTNDGRDGVIFYSLGNTTTFAQLRLENRIGEMAEIELAVSVNARGEKTVIPQKIGVTPFLYCRRKHTSQTEHRLVPLRSTAKLIREGAPPPYLTHRQCSELLRAEKEYASFFVQMGIHWR